MSSLLSVYLISNAVNGKVYVGQTRKSIEARFSEHLSNARRLKRSRFYSAIRKHGAGAFSICCLAYAESRDQASLYERTYIEKFRANDERYGYNLTLGGEGIDGFRHSAETRAILSRTQKGKSRTPMVRALLLRFAIGSTHNRGRKHTAEHVAKRVEKLKGRRWHWQRALTPDEKEVKRRQMIGRVVTSETRKKISLANKGCSEAIKKGWETRRRNQQ